ncbi:MAG TPA: chemotaxis protein CheD [Deltaproteobacteria bacterium]|jgi:chemotaxis protein CheD|nr:chemotaxis protein CheD [Deltaproteobacteria bacterium]HIJ75517.1 chemotaxis protein CheD [Deltaproteobacteria bacterium]
MRRVIGVADMALSDSPEELLITYSLGSCIAVIIFDPLAGVGGMLHYMLPESSLDPEKAKKNPCVFADTGITHLFKNSYLMGAKKEHMVVKTVGGAQILDPNGIFNIGTRNYLAMRKIFWRNNVAIAAEHVGGENNRTVRLEMDTGRVILKVGTEAEIEI